VRARRLARAALACLLASGPSSAGAQSPHDRIYLDRLHDSLAAALDPAALTRSYDAARRAPGRAPAVLRELRLGLTALRLAQLDGRSRADAAIDHFRRAARREPAWPYAWDGLGLAEPLRAEREQRERLALGSRVGIGTLERAAERHGRALESDPGFVPAALALADLTLALRDTARFAAARDALRDVVTATPAPPPELLLAWGRLERAAGSPDSAGLAFGRFVDAGGSRALGLLETARTALAAGQSGAEAGYFEGAGLDDSVAAAGYRADLEPIAADSDLARFDSLGPTGRAAFLRRFWTHRDRYEMRAEGERIREHYRRLLHARRSFALTVSRRFYGAADAYRSGSEELDDRGIIYVRHGEPGERLRPFVFGLMPNESWRYARAEGDLLFHFSAGYDEQGGGDLYDYRLVRSVLDLRGASAAPSDQLMLSRQSLSPVYGRMLNWGRYGRARARAWERGIGQASIAIGTETDSYELQFVQPLPALADLVAVGERDGNGLAHLVLAVPASALRAGEPLRVRLVALPQSDRPAVAVDTTLDVGDPGAEAGRYFVGRVELPLAAGAWTWRAALQQGDSAGTVMPRDTVRVTERGRGLALSDLALGLPAASATWQPTPADTVRLTPFDLFPERSDVELYYEAAGASPAASYRHDIAVYRVKGGSPRVERRPVVSLSVEEAAGSEVLRAHRRLQLGRLKPGRYVVEVRVSGGGAIVATRSRAFTVVADR
jgi:GWxTD domain-containing protein